MAPASGPGSRGRPGRARRSTGPPGTGDQVDRAARPLHQDPRPRGSGLPSPRFASDQMQPRAKSADRQGPAVRRGVDPLVGNATPDTRRHRGQLLAGHDRSAPARSRRTARRPRPLGVQALTDRQVQDVPAGVAARAPRSRATRSSDSAPGLRDAVDLLVTRAPDVPDVQLRVPGRNAKRKGLRIRSRRSGGRSPRRVVRAGCPRGEPGARVDPDHGAVRPTGRRGCGGPARAGSRPRRPVRRTGSPSDRGRVGRAAPRRRWRRACRPARRPRSRCAWLGNCRQKSSTSTPRAPVIVSPSRGQPETRR